MLTSSISNNCRCHSVGVSCNFVWMLIIWIDWQMLLPIDGYYVLKYGRCYCQPCFLWQMFKPLLFMSDGIDVMALVVYVTDVIVTYILIW